MFCNKYLYFFIFNLFIIFTNCELSDKRLCIDEKCSEVISLAKTLIKYHSPEIGVLSFLPNQNVKIFSYGAGKRPELIGVEINGRKGYINKNHVKETRLVKQAKLVLDTETVSPKYAEIASENERSQIKSDTTKKPYEIIDGTKFPVDLTQGTIQIDTKKPTEDVVLEQFIDQQKKVEDNIKPTTAEVLEEKLEKNEEIDKKDSNEKSNNEKGVDGNEEKIVENKIVSLDSSINTTNENLTHAENETKEEIQNKLVENNNSTDSSKTENNETVNITEKENSNLLLNLAENATEKLPINETVSNNAKTPEVTDVALESLSESNIDSIDKNQINNTDPELISNSPASEVPIKTSSETIDNILPLFNSIEQKVSEEAKIVSTEATTNVENIIKEPEEIKLVVIEETANIEDLIEVKSDVNEEIIPIENSTVNNIDSNEQSDSLKEENIVEDSKEIETGIVEEIDPILEEPLADESEPLEEVAGSGFFSAVQSFFSLNTKVEEHDIIPETTEEILKNLENEIPAVVSNNREESFINQDEYCVNEKCSLEADVAEIPHANDEYGTLEELLFIVLSSDMFLYLSTTSVSVLILIVFWIILDKCRRERPLIGRINKLEQQLLATLKENAVLQQEASLSQTGIKTDSMVQAIKNEEIENLKLKLSEMDVIKQDLEEQIQALEKELDTSTEMGIELNKIISEMLNSSDGNEIIKENIDKMQKRLVEQQTTINTLNENLEIKESENAEIRLDMEISSKKTHDLQKEVNMMVEKILKIEDERNKQHGLLENEIALYKNKCSEALTQEHNYKSEIISLNQKLAKLQRISETKIKEYNSLKETLSHLKNVKNDKESLKSFLEVSEIKAQLEQLNSENLNYSEQLSKERESNLENLTQLKQLTQELNEFKLKYEKADKEKVEINTKLDVLNNYFKEKEEQFQKEIGKYENLWAAKEGEVTSTSERFKYMDEELRNYKTQNENLKQEILNQEMELKSQISVLEKKSHENWMQLRQMERKLEETKQESALLRNRLTMRECNNSIRIQSPSLHHQNGDGPLSPPPNSAQSPPPPHLFNSRDHLTKSPPIPGMPHPPPFLPPPFMPPPPLDGMMPPPIIGGDLNGMPHFLPGLMFPGDHRPPPLGRMSSPPPVGGGRYTPESTVYSEYDRYDRSPSPRYDSEYGGSPPNMRNYSPYNNDRNFQNSGARTNGRNPKGIPSSGSENDSLGKSNKKLQRKV